jgi:hypothetical protein
MVCVANVTDLAADLARDCAGGRNGRQEADKDRIEGLPKRQRKRSGRVHRKTEAKDDQERAKSEARVVV